MEASWSRGVAVAAIVGAVVGFSGCVAPSKIEIDLSVLDEFSSPLDLVRTVQIEIDIPGYNLADGTMERSPWSISNLTMAARKEGWRVVNIDTATTKMTRAFQAGVDCSVDGPFTYTFQPQYEVSEQREAFSTHYSYTGSLRGSLVGQALVTEGYKVAATMMQQYGIPDAERPEVCVEFPVTWHVRLPSRPDTFDSGELVVDAQTIENRFRAQEFAYDVPIRFAWTNNRGYLGTLPVAVLLFAVVAVLIGLGAATARAKLARRRKAPRPAGDV